ncbi:MAG: Ig-like domain-containing protein, partial [Candidatus Margulisiibacteriota bacterium]
EVDGLTSPAYTVADKLTDQTVYYWKVKAIDKRGLNTWSRGSPWQFMVDTGEAAPYIVSFSPTDEAIGVDTNAAILVQFNKKMNQDSVEGALSVTAIRDKNGKSIDQDRSGTITWGDNAMTFIPNSAWVKNYTYRVKITTGAKDFGGSKLDRAKTWNFATILDYLLSNVVVASDGLTKVGLSPLAFEKDAYIDINLSPIDHPKRIDPSIVTRANNKVIQQGNPFHYPLIDTLTEINPYDSRDNLIALDFKVPVTLTMPFTDEDNDGFVDETTPPIKAENLLIYHLNEVDALWVRMPGSTVNRLPNNAANTNTSSVDLMADVNTVFAPVVHFPGVYVLMSTPATDLTMAYAYPVPFKPSEGHTKIVFTNLASECTIKIFTVSGGLVRTLKEDSGTGQHSWDVKTDGGADVVSGVYFYLIQSTNDKKMGKLVIIR